MRKAVIDVGSNSVLLLVAEMTPSGWKTIYEDTSVTALGYGTKQSGLLTDAGMRDTLAALAKFFTKAASYEATTIAAATMAARIARNTGEFQAMAAAQGTPVSILSGEDEATLGFLAVCTDPMFRNEPILSIIDPGGQSTELINAEQAPAGIWNENFKRSFPIGTLAMRSGILSEERCSGPQLLTAATELDGLIGLEFLPHRAGTAVVLGATGTNLVSIRDRLTRWQPELVHGASLDFEEISQAVGYLGRMSDEERASVPGMEPGREKTIHLGALILERFLHAIHVLDVKVSVRGWRHALLERSV